MLTSAEAVDNYELGPAKPSALLETDQFSLVELTGLETRNDGDDCPQERDTSFSPSWRKVKREISFH